MDFSAANTALWNVIIQLGILSCAVIVSTMLARKIPGLRRFALPTSVLAGFLLLALRSFGVIRMMEPMALSMISIRPRDLRDSSAASLLSNCCSTNTRMLVFRRAAARPPYSSAER